MLFDSRYPSFGNFDSTIPIDVVGTKSYMDSLFDPTCVPLRLTINKLNFAPISDTLYVESCNVNVNATKYKPMSSSILQHDEQ